MVVCEGGVCKMRGSAGGKAACSALQRMSSEPPPIKSANPLVRLEAMERLLAQFRHVAGKTGCLGPKEFKKAAEIKSDFFASRLFKAIDTDGNSLVTCDEFVNFMYTLECQDMRGRLQILFNVYDMDGSGGLTLDELIELLLASVQESNSQMELEVVEHLAQTIMDSFDVDGDGEISFEEFVEATSKYPDLVVGLTLANLGKDSRKRRLSVWGGITYTLQQPFRTVINNPQRTLWLVVLIASLMAMFYWRLSMYMHGPKCDLMGWTLPLAKGCGQMIKLTTTLILLPVSRATMTWLRATPLRHIIPFDDAMQFHILLGTLGFVFAWIHTLAHVNDIYKWGDRHHSELFKAAFPEEQRQPSHMELCMSLVAVTGMIQLISYSLVFLTASNWPRRAPWMVNTRLGKYLNNFKLIWRVHHLAAVYIVSLLFHPMPNLPDESNEWGYSDVWVWVGVPVFIYILERIARLYRQTKDVQILCAELLPGKVFSLMLTKPKGFEYKTGMYLYVMCPTISQWEWHPFSITSAPGADHLSLHIRVVGDWTEELYNRFLSYGRTVRHEELLQTCLRTFVPTLESKAKAQGLQDTEPSPVALATVSQQVLNGMPLVKDSTRIERKGSVPLEHWPSCLLEQGMERQWSSKSTNMVRQLSAPPSVIFPPASACDAELRGGTPFHVPISVNAMYEDSWDDVGHSSEGSSAKAAGTNSTSQEEYRVVIVEDTSSAESAVSALSPGLCPVRSSVRSLPRSPVPSPGRKVTFKGPAATPFASTAVSPSLDCIEEGRPADEPMPIKDSPVYAHTPRLQQRQHSFIYNLDHVKNPEIAAGDIPVKLRIDGPFGAPAQGYTDYSVLLLVGAGIGVTPFASVLSDLIHRMRQSSKEGSVIPQFQKVYFYWSVRSQSEVVWFSRVLEAIGREDVLGILDINVHITGLRQANDVRTMPLKLLQVAVHKQTGMDVMSGLNGRVLTRFGRPDWARVFRDLQVRHSKEKKIGVFYSGPNTLASVLKKLSNKYSTRGNKFHFTKEAFGYW
ncbi:unnamed protein product [Ostreobium quekettii]|uniref:Uncharacterized protein n=1 Tax=Ostreobium quekettii TaxID=121088 RepID=A0A8S1IX23_9CHLO|nr:unnamed protein product [Ostreobium quekettii]|eukprot:evm.model.scf_1575EXC.1 EVM.evm.TU.scf_1575EXC.1   scf_1575EXC:9115-18214(-)